MSDNPNAVIEVSNLSPEDGDNQKQYRRSITGRKPIQIVDP